MAAKTTEPLQVQIDLKTLLFPPQRWINNVAVPEPPSAMRTSLTVLGVFDK